MATEEKYVLEINPVRTRLPTEGGINRILIEGFFRNPDGRRVSNTFDSIYEIINHLLKKGLTIPQIVCGSKKVDGLFTTTLFAYLKESQSQTNPGLSPIVRYLISKLDNDEKFQVLDNIFYTATYGYGIKDDDDDKNCLKELFMELLENNIDLGSRIMQRKFKSNQPYVQVIKECYDEVVEYYTDRNDRIQREIEKKRNVLELLQDLNIPLDIGKIATSYGAIGNIKKFNFSLKKYTRIYRKSKRKSPRKSKRKSPRKSKRKSR
jgi:hypothetical protein